MSDSLQNWGRVARDPTDVLLERVAALEVEVSRRGGYGDAINAKDGYATLQAAADKAKASSCKSLYIPGGTYTPSSTPSLVGNLDVSGLQVFGAGINATVLRLDDASYKDTNIILIKEPVTSLFDLNIKGPNVARTDTSAPETGPDAKDKGIGVYAYAAGQYMWDIRMARIYMEKTSGWGIKITTDAGQAAFTNTLEDVQISTCKASGALFYGGPGGATTLTVRGGSLNGPGYSTHGKDAGKAECTRGALHLENATACNFYGTVLETPDSSTAISMSSSGSHGFHDCYFEPGASSSVFGWIITTSGHMQPCHFKNAYINRHDTAVGLRLLRTGATASSILPFKFEDCYWVSAEGAASDDDFDFGNAADVVLLDNVTFAGFGARALSMSPAGVPVIWRHVSGDGLGAAATDTHFKAAGTMSVEVYP